jgi:hypothetical protein
MIAAISLLSVVPTPAEASWAFKVSKDAFNDQETPLAFAFGTGSYLGYGLGWSCDAHGQAFLAIKTPTPFTVPLTEVSDADAIFRADGGAVGHEKTVAIPQNDGSISFAIMGVGAMRIIQSAASAKAKFAFGLEWSGSRHAEAIFDTRNSSSVAKAFQSACQ